MYTKLWENYGRLCCFFVGENPDEKSWGRGENDPRPVLLARCVDPLPCFHGHVQLRSQAKTAIQVKIEGPFKSSFFFAETSLLNN